MPSKLKRAIELLVFADYCSIITRRDAAEQQQAWMEIRSRARSKHGTASAWANAAMRLTWPPRALWLSIVNVRRFGRAVAEHSRKPVFRQLIEQLRWSLSTGRPPRHYYDYELYSAATPHPLEFIAQHEVDEVRWVFDAARVVSSIQDKRAFGALCVSHGIATPVLLSARQAVEHAELFCKPATGSHGAGAEVWSRQADGEYLGSNGRRLAADRLTAHLEQRDQDWVIQPRLLNHPTIDDLGNGALCTARIVTGRTPPGDVQVVAATFKMPRARRITNTYGFNSPIDLQSGRLGRAYSYNPICPGYDHHPDTRAEITSRVLPLWHDALAIVNRIHQLITGHVFIGWDVAFAPDGVMLLEGNSGWDVLTVQKPQRTPLTRTCFLEICRMWVEASGPPGKPSQATPL